MGRRGCKQWRRSIGAIGFWLWLVVLVLGLCMWWTVRRMAVFRNECIHLALLEGGEANLLLPPQATGPHGCL